jgi:outer membrane protein OmpA-like peptidoglycan-associated protein
MPVHDADTVRGIARPRARAPTALVSGIAALLGFGAAAAARSPAPDTDCDGVVDASDDCRAVAEDRDGHDDADGCPDADNDGDRIADIDDQCPDEAEVVNDFQDADGCPDRAVEVWKDRIELKQRIHFAFDRSEILRRSYPILAEIAETVREHPEVRVIRVEGHADDQGSVHYNLKLSERRAVAVRDHLIDLGIKPARLVDIGYGESRRSAEGTSENARAQNRRVEFLIEFALVRRPSRAGAVRERARARASFRSAVNRFHAQAEPGCAPVAPPARERASRTASWAGGVGSSDPQEASPTLLPWGTSLSAGGGVTAFADDEMRGLTDVGGSWEARLTVGTRDPVAVEASYLGSAQAIDALGLDPDAVLVSHGLGGAVRANIFTGRHQAYLLAGAAWRRYDVTSASFNTSSLNDHDDVLEVPLGVGFSYRLDHIILDGRGVYRRVFFSDLLQATSGRDRPGLDTLTATLMGGFEF